MLDDKWHSRFIKLADMVATWSKDPSTKVGAVITQEKHVISLGYNGFPAGIVDGEDDLANRSVKYAMTVHAEINAIIQAHGRGDTLYCTHFCCSNCAAAIINAGIKNVYFRVPSSDMISRWGESFEIAKHLFQEANVLVMLIP